VKILHEDGFAYIAPIHRGRLGPYFSPLPIAILEDGLPLPGPANALHEDIRRNGKGRSSFWKGYVYFSTSDNTDPRTNGRRYEIEYLGAVSSMVAALRDRTFGIARRIRSAICSDQENPVNFQPRVVTGEALEKDVEYATQIGMNYVKLISDSRSTVAGKVVLEIGPGINFGSALLLGCLGARVMVADRFLAPWDEAYHFRFYGLLRDWLLKNMPSADSKPLDMILSGHEYCDEAIRCLATPLEKLDGIANESVDVIFSNAVLEHLPDPAVSFAQMKRVSVLGGRGYHQVDFRDHLDFSRPLEFLLMSARAFSKDFKDRHGERGNRFRASEYSGLFRKSGFRVLEFKPNRHADDAYIEDFLDRFDRMGFKRQHYAIEDFKHLSGLFSVERVVMDYRYPN
jgi:SAM-dependent methyltransferase